MTICVGLSILMLVLIALMIGLFWYEYQSIQKGFERKVVVTYSKEKDDGNNQGS